MPYSSVPRGYCELGDSSTPPVASTTEKPLGSTISGAKIAISAKNVEHDQADDPGLVPR